MEMWTRNPVTYLDLHIFGSPVYGMYNTQESTKIDPRSRKCLFLGYADGVKGYRLWDPTAHKEVYEVNETNESQALTTRTLNCERRRQVWHSYYFMESKIAYLLLTEEGEPSTLQEALNNLDASLWMAGMQEEIESLHKNKTWELMPLRGGDLDGSKSTAGYVFALSGRTVAILLQSDVTFLNRDLGPFGNVFDIPDGGAIDGNTVFNPAQLPFNESSGGSLAYYQRRVEELTSSLYQTEGMLAMAQAMNESMQTTVNRLLYENESLKSYYSMSCAGYNNLFEDLTKAKELEVNLSKKVTSLKQEKVGLRHDLEWVMRKVMHMMLAKVFRSEQFENEMLKVQKVLIDWGRDLGRQEARDRLMSN
ncbi:gag-pol polyprotein [Tanacetum coccineum]